MKKRLLKDLPFGNLNKDTVLYRVNGSYQVSGGKTYYKEGGDSSNATYVCEPNERDIIDLIFDNPSWFEEAIVEYIDVIPTTTSITLRFKPIDIDDAEDLAKGVMKQLEKLKEDKGYVWSKFSNIKTRITNR